MEIPDFQPQQQQQTTTVGPKKDKLKKYLPIGIGVLISIAIVVLAFGVLQGFFTRASGSIPQSVVVSDQTQNSVKITWTTFNAPETEKTKNHSVELTLLSPNTTYYYQISVGDKKFDNGGIPWTFTTKDIVKTQPLQTDLSPTPKAATTSPVISPTVTPSECLGVDCNAIKAKIGKGCTTRDYFVCVNKLSGTPTQ